MDTHTSRYVDGTYCQTVPGWHAEDSPRKAAHILRMLARHRLTPRLVCDVGCGAGEILVELQRRMPERTEFAGFDISPQAIDLCRPKENPRLTFILADVSCQEIHPRPDLLLLLDVFEHVPDYVGFLEALRDKASWFIFHVPLDLSLQALRKDAESLLEMRTEFGHLHQFTKDTALATLTDAGYDIVDHFYTDSWQAAPPKGLKQRVAYEARRLFFRWKPDSAALVFDGYNLLVLARPAT
ncbi:MAG: class I SAM-dependent methyltransferase [Planctomycetota bacterium]|jgi:2-polyprenyl-3-methyl-5-hydroxy-6-metoxy-1,4-benzoquinol methylase